MRTSFSIGPNSYHCLALSVTVSHSLPQCSCWNLVDVTLACEDSRNLFEATRPPIPLPAVVSFDSHVKDIGRKQMPCCSCQNKTKAMLLMLEQNTDKRCCWCWNKTKAMVSKISDHLKTTWICQGCSMDLLMLLRGFGKGVLCISCPLPNKTKLLKILSELKVLNESKYSMP